jgi:hypothetical protein
MLVLEAAAVNEKSAQWRSVRAGEKDEVERNSAWLDPLRHASTQTS